MTATFHHKHVVLLAALVMLSGVACSDNTEYTRVSFSQEAPVDRGPAASQGNELQVAVAAMISPQETFSNYKILLDYIGNKISRDVRMVQRKTYAEVNLLLKEGKLDLAFICSGPYATARDNFGFDALVTPVVRGEPFYQAYLIVNKESGIRSLEELRGKRFAFTDPDSNTGALVPKYWLGQIGERAESFFGKSVFTASHDNSIMAVARSLVDGATVDGHVWEYFNARSPVFTAKTVVIRKSIPFGGPPIVAAKHLDRETRDRIQEVLLHMHADENGKRILSELLIDQFIPSNLEWYRTIEDLYTKVQASKASFK